MTLTEVRQFKTRFVTPRLLMIYIHINFHSNIHCDSWIIDRTRNTCCRWINFSCDLATLLKPWFAAHR